MKSTLFLLPAVALALFGGTKNLNAQEYYGPPQFAYGQHEAEEAWERRGFFDGVNGADHDYWNHRRADVNNRDEYRDPDSVPRWARHEYREGFRRGYYHRVREIYGREGRRDFDDE